MIYIKGINPTTNDIIYYRRFLNSKCVSWTETLAPDQTHFFENIEIAQNLITYLLSLNIAITNLEIVESI